MISPPFHILAFKFCFVGVVGCTASPPAPSPERPQRIVSQLVLGDEVLWELGEDVRARVVGVSRLADDVQYSGEASKWPRRVPRLPGDVESLLALEPDLVLVASFTNQDVRRMLRVAQIPTVVIERFGGFADFADNVRLIAKAVGATPAGEQLLETFEEELRPLRRPARDHGEVVSFAGGIVAAAGTTFDDAARAAGLTNIPAREGLVGYQRISLEQLVTWNPRWIVVGCAPGRCPETQREAQASLGVEQTQAGQHNGIIAVPEAVLSSTGMKMLELVRALRDGTRALDGLSQ